jgi:Ca2+-binding RTX toxin-like protein
VVALGTTAGTPVTLNLGGGNDVVHLATSTGSSLDGFAASTPVTVNGEAGADAILLNDQVDGNGNSYVVTDTGVTRNFNQMILSYAAAESLTLNGGNFADTVTVQSTLAATPVTLRMGGGDDVVNVGSLGNSLDPILGAVTVDGQAGADRLNVNDQGSIFGTDYTVTSTTVSRTGAASITYAGLENLTINAAAAQLILFNNNGNGQGHNNFFVKSTSAATTINGAALLRDEFIVGSDGRSLDGIQGGLTVNGRLGTENTINGAGDSLVLKDQGDTNANSYTITSAGVARSGAALISYSNLSNLSSPATLLNLFGGAFNDTVAVRSAAATTRMKLDMGNGNDTITLGGGPFFMLNGIASSVLILNPAGSDAIILDDVDLGAVPIAGRNYDVLGGVVSRNGLFILSYDLRASLELRAGGGDDTFTGNGAAVIKAGHGNDTFKDLTGFGSSMTFDGQGGVDTLDFSARTVPVRANMAAGTAGTGLGSFSNVENVLGTAFDDILVGNDLANVLKGGAGRDLLIGRGGADALVGESGDDILIGATTVHDLNAAALEDLMREWGRTDLVGTAQEQYATRINPLLGATPGGLNGTTRLYLNLVTEDGAADSLDGGTELDWFFKLGADIILGLGATERVN